MNMDMNDQGTHIPRRPAIAQEADAAAQSAESAADAIAPNPARKRVPFGTPQLKLDYEQRPGFHRRYFNDVPGRIQRAQNAGYSHVKNHEGNNVTATVGVAKEGGGLMAYLMEIPKELFDEDQAVKMQAIKEFDAAIRRGVDAGGHAPGQDGRYVPVDAYGKPKISIERR